MNHHAREGDLVEVMVQDLAQRAAVVRPSCLLTINAIDCLVPEVGPDAEQPDPAWQILSEARIHGDDCHKADKRE